MSIGAILLLAAIVCCVGWVYWLDRQDQQRSDRYREAAADSFSDYAEGLEALDRGENPFEK